MSFPTRPLTSHVRQPSMGANAGAPSAALVARVKEKRAELEHLKELQELSAAMASQMEALEQKLATLSDGTEAISLVMSNWHNVLQVINMGSSKLANPPKTEGEEETVPLPEVLVRIPTEHAPNVQAHAEAEAEAGAESD